MNPATAGRVLAAAVLLATTTASADGEGTLSDAALTLSYEGSNLVMPQPAAPFAGDPVCQDGTPTCDVYTLTVNVSDAYRNEKKNDGAYVDFTLSFGADDDWDMFFFDAGGSELARSAGTVNPEVISVALSDLPNGSYSIKMHPWLPAAEGFNLAINVANPGSAKNGVLGGATAAVLLLSLAGLAGVRRRRR